VALRIYVDDQEWTEQTFPEEKDALWREIAQRIGREGRVPCEVRVDGELLDQEAFASLSGGNEVRIRTESLRELLRDSLEQAKHYVPALVGGLGAIADRFEAEKPQEALMLLHQASEGVEWLFKVLENTRMLSGIEEGEIGDGDFAASRNSLALTLQVVVTALEEGRYFETAYKIREELLPVVTHMGTYVDAMSQLVGNRVQ
jgi:hypothetical protein